MSQKQGTLIAMGIQIAGLLISLLVVLGRGITPVFLIISAVALTYSLVLGMYLRGWRVAPYLMVILVTLVTGMTADPAQGMSVHLLMPAAVALVMTPPIWVLGAAIVTWGAVLARTGGAGNLADPETGMFFLATVASMIIARVVIETAQRRAEASAQHAAQEQAHTEDQARALTEANQRQEEQLAKQRVLLDVVASLETPAIQLSPGVLFAPITGHLDTLRAERFTSNLLHEAHRQRAQLIILDLSGVRVIDTAIIQVLVHTAQALQLLGCTVCLSGLSSSIAMTLVELGEQLQGIKTVQTPHEAITRYAPTAQIDAVRTR